MEFSGFLGPSFNEIGGPIFRTGLAGGSGYKSATMKPEIQRLKTADSDDWEKQPNVSFTSGEFSADSGAGGRLTAQQLTYEEKKLCATLIYVLIGIMVIQTYVLVFSSWLSFIMSIIFSITASVAKYFFTKLDQDGFYEKPIEKDIPVQETRESSFDWEDSSGGEVFEKETNYPDIEQNQLKERLKLREASEAPLDDGIVEDTPQALFDEAGLSSPPRDPLPLVESTTSEESSSEKEDFPFPLEGDDESSSSEKREPIHYEHLEEVQDPMTEPVPVDRSKIETFSYNDEPVREQGNKEGSMNTDDQDRDISFE